nr:reverse transcriptase [Tanacetum cinerariifolium]
MALLSTPGSTNKVDTATIQVSTVSTLVSIVSAHDNTANLSDATVGPRNQESRLRNQDNSRKTVIIEDTSSKAMVEINGVVFDWSYMADDKVPTNMALMAFSDSELCCCTSTYRLICTLTIDLSSSGLEEFKQPEFECYGPKASKSVFVDTSNVIKKHFDALIIEDWVFDCDEDESDEMVVKYENVQHKREQVNQPRKVNQNPKNNRTNWNEMRTYKLRVGNFAPTAVLTKSGIVPTSTARQRSSRATAPVSAARPINTAAPKPIRKSVTSAVGKQGTNVFKSSACWVWRPKIKVQDHVSKNSRLYICKRFDYVDPEGRLKPTFIKSIMGKMYCLVVTDYCSSFSWVFFLAKKDKTSGILNDFITQIENQLNHKVKIIRCDDKTEFKNYEMNQFCGLKGIKREFRSGPKWLFNIDSLTNSMNYQPLSAGNRTNGIAGLNIHSDAGQEGREKVSDQEYILLPVMNTSSDVPSSNEEFVSSPKDDADKKSTVEPTCVEGDKIDDLGCLDQQIKSIDDFENTNGTNSFNTASLTVNTASDKDITFQRTYGEWNFSTPIIVNAIGSSFSHPATLDDFFKMPNMEDIRIFDDAYDDRDEGLEADYNNLETEIYVSQPPGFVDPKFPNRVYKVEKALYGLHQAPRAWYETLSNYLLENGFRKGTIDKTLFIKKIKNDILLVQVYVDDIILGSTKRPDIMFAMCASSRLQVQPKVYHMHAIKRIFRYLKGHLTLGLWYPKDSPLELIAYSESDYAEIHMDSVDNVSAIYVVKYPVYHSKTKHIKIMHHFIRDSYEKRLIEMVKIHTNYNVADLLTNAFDYATMMRQNKNLMDINIDALYNILKKKQGDVNDAIGSKKKTVVVTSDPLALIAEKTNVSRSKEKVVVSSDSKGSEADDFSELKKITALLRKAFNRRKFYSKPTNNNLRTSSFSQSANKKQEFVKTDTKKVEKKDEEKKRDISRVKCYNCKKEGHFTKDCKKAKVKNYEYYKTKMLLAKKDKDEQVLLAEDQAWMESSSDLDREINANMVFMAQIEKVLSDSEASSSSADEKISEDILYNGRKGIGFKNPRYFEKAKELRPILYDEKFPS